MIYLIDDTPVQMLEEFFNPSDYADVLKRVEEFSEDDIFSLTWASCVMIHSSFRDQMVKRQILKYLNFGDVAPLVVFSDGDSPEAQFDSDSFITAIKKRVLYSRLPKLLEEYRKTNEVNLKLLVGSPAQNQKKNEETPSAGNAFADFFSKHNVELAPEKETPKLKGPRTYFIGREGMDKLARSVGGEFIKVVAGELKDAKVRNQDAKIHDFLCSHLPEEVEALYLDTDADPALFMRLALHFRLTESLKGDSKYAPIIFVSDYSLEKLVAWGKESVIFMTAGGYPSTRATVVDQFGTYAGLEKDSYRELFLDKIFVESPQGSHHSIANQWGASRLYMIIKGRNAEEESFKDFQDIHKDLYFKYIFHRIPASVHRSVAGADEFKVKGCTGKRILLIDDEADKGWSKTMDLLFPMARFDVVSEEVKNYESFSDEAKKKIESPDNDLILLDLRLGGMSEDYIVNPEDMSGYKVLRAIKERNRGTQVIILTASNKAWNLKALMQPGLGADGYFVKESPEYEFSDELSTANLRSLIADAERCLRNGYLRDFWNFVCMFEKSEKDLVKEVYAQLRIAYDMAAQANAPEKCQYAYLGLYRAMEIVVSSLAKWVSNTDRNNPDTKLLQLDGSDLAKAIVYPADGEVFTRQKPFAHQMIRQGQIFPTRDKLSALYLQKWGKQDHGVLFLMGQLIAIRNSIIHPENLEAFDLKTPMREATILQSSYFNDVNAIFGSLEYKTLYREAASLGLLYADSSGRPTLHRDIAMSTLGLRFLLACYKDYLTAILS